MNVLIVIFCFWLALNIFALTLILISEKRFDYLIQFTAYFYCKNILDFILKFIILFAYLPFHIASLIKEIFNE